MTAYWRTRLLRGRDIEIRAHGSALAATTWMQVTETTATTSCTCRTLLHALTAETRQRVRTARDRALEAGHHDLAEHYQARLSQCPTNRATTTETKPETPAMTDTTLVSKAAEVPASNGAHMHRTAVLLVVLQRVDGAVLPEIRSWSSRDRDYRTEPRTPGLRGDLKKIYFSLEAARADVRAWADALGTTMTERYVEGHSREIELVAAVEVDGVWVRVGTHLPVDDRCPGCGGPAIGDTVLRHFTDAPCAGSLALQA